MNFMSSSRGPTPRVRIRPQRARFYGSRPVSEVKSARDGTAVPVAERANEKPELHIGSRYSAHSERLAGLTARRSR